MDKRMIKMTKKTKTIKLLWKKELIDHSSRGWIRLLLTQESWDRTIISLSVVDRDDGGGGDGDGGGDDVVGDDGEGGGDDVVGDDGEGGGGDVVGDDDDGGKDDGLFTPILPR